MSYVMDGMVRYSEDQQLLYWQAERVPPTSQSVKQGRDLHAQVHTSVRQPGTFRCHPVP
jgi:hypothetical protein